MEKKLTFREYVKDRYGSTIPDYSELNAFRYFLLSLENDATFPDDEVDGIEVRKYIRNKQLIKERNDDSSSMFHFNRGVIYHFERLWEEYKERLNA